MARSKRIKSRRGARKQKFIEIEGHRLTAAMHAEYQRLQESRERTNRGASAWRIAQLALEDFLAKYSISHTGNEQLGRLSGQLTELNLAIANLANYPFWGDRNRTTRLAGCDTLSRLAVELHLIGEKVYLIGQAIRYESGTKLQDWQARQKVIDEVSWPPKEARP